MQTYSLFQTTPNLKSKLLLDFRYTLSFLLILGEDYPITPVNLPDTQASSTIHEMILTRLQSLEVFNLINCDLKHPVNQ